MVVESFPSPSQGTAAVLLPALRDALSRDPILAALCGDDLEVLLPYMQPLTFEPGGVIVRQDDTGRDLYFIGDGQVRLRRNAMDLGRQGPGEHFGELGLLTGRPRAATVSAETQVTVLRLTHDRWRAMAQECPNEALRLVQSLVSRIAHRLTEMTDRVDLLLKERSMPRRSAVHVQLNGRLHRVRTGTPLHAILPVDVDGYPVVAGLIDHKPVSLNTPLTSDAHLAPLTTQHWEGRAVFRQSVALLLLEAAKSEGVEIRIGPSLGYAQRVEVVDDNPGDLQALADRLAKTMRELAAGDVPFRVELWTVEEAMIHFGEQMWDDAAHLLRSHRESTVPLVSCGKVYALGLGPLLPSAGIIRNFSLVEQGRELMLYFGDDDKQVHAHGEEAPVAHAATDARMVTEHERWADRLGVTSAGAFNEFCISGKVSNIIRISEGFHEKRLGAVADEIAQRTGVRVVCVAGPSSSGKTTFIKRLTVQLQVNGLNPIGISLDDYYVDREKTVKDEHGEYDFEALEAIDLGLLQNHLRRLMAGETVKTSKYDFKLGKSLPEGGPELHLDDRDILMLEGIHGLNPGLLGDAVDRDLVYRIFINPQTALPFDRLNRVNVSDLRLLRRIVRDRHQRGYSAADNIARWPSVRRGESLHIFPFLPQADVVFDSSLIYELSVLKVFAERYLLEVDQTHPSYMTAYRLRQLIDRFVTIYPDHVPPTSILREFIGGSGFEY
jgi:uridine kinase